VDEQVTVAVAEAEAVIADDQAHTEAETDFLQELKRKLRSPSIIGGFFLKRRVP